MEFMRIETSPAETGEIVSEGFDTPASRTEKMAMLIHQIHLFCPISKTADGEVKTSIGDREATEVSDVDIGEPGVITKMECYTLTAPEQVQTNEHQMTYYDPPILYAKRQIWASVANSGSVGGKRCSAHIGYTVEKVSQEDFISALVED
ncbi:hypothetical protein ES705_42496 [subsurface metagenome]